MRPRRVLAAFLIAFSTAGCRAEGPDVHGAPWPAADALFHRDPHWVGGDGSYSVDLGGGRILWMFGDSLIAREPGSKSNAAFIRNSAALETGTDPSRAFMEFFWRDEDGSPKSFIPEQGADLFWPKHGVRLGDKLFVFYEDVQNVDTGDPQFNFSVGLSRLLVVDDPDDAPSTWSPRDARMPANTFGITLGGAVLVHGDHVVVYGDMGSSHSLYLARAPADRFAAEDFSDPEWWSGSAGWLTESAGASPEAVIDTFAPEYSVHEDARLGSFVAVHTEGFGASTIAIRSAPAPEGPWSSPRTFYRPPESFADNAFVYAAKAHPELSGADLVVTYVPSLFGDEISPDTSLYVPHFVRVTYP